VCKYRAGRALEITPGNVLASIRAKKLDSSAVKCKYSSASRRTPRPARIQQLGITPVTNICKEGRRASCTSTLNSCKHLKNLGFGS
jgi:hypothetical protein